MSDTHNFDESSGEVCALSAPPHIGPGPHFCWLSVKFLETVSSPRPSNFREISGKFVTFFSPSADGPSAMWSRTGRNGREKFRIQSEHSDFWYEPRPCPEHGLNKCFVMISGGPDDASDSPGGHLRGILTPAEERALDFFVRGVKFPWKFPESCFHPRGQISKGISMEFPGISKEIWARAKAWLAGCL